MVDRDVQTEDAADSSTPPARRPAQKKARSSSPEKSGGAGEVTRCAPQARNSQQDQPPQATEWSTVVTGPKGTPPVQPGEFRNDRYRTRDVVEILNISRRQLQYWAQTDLVVPSAQTPGGHSRYSFEDLVALKTAKRLIDAGVSVQRIRKSIRKLREVLPTVRRPLAELTLVATGDVVLAFREGTVFDAVSGQEWVFEVARFRREVDAWKRSPSTHPAAPRPRAVRSTQVRNRTG